jgi:hypothetical protein
MKQKFSLLFFIISTINCFAVNDIKQLEKTIKSFQDQLLIKPLVISNEFILTFEEFSFFASMQSKDKLDPLQIRKDYDRNYINRIVNKTNDFNENFKSLQSVISHDTLTYYERQNRKEVINFIDISFVIKYKDPFGSDEISTRYKFKFAIINNKIKLTGQLYSQSEFSYGLEKMEILQSQEKSDFNSKFKGKIFDRISANSIPKFKNGKWGLVNFKYEEIIPCVYDSIYPFVNSFSLVVINGKYNLLDTSFKLQLKNNASKIKCEDGRYLILNNKKAFVSFPFEDKNDKSVAIDAPAQKQIAKTRLENKADSESDFWISNEYSYEKHINNRYVIDNNTKDTLAKKSDFDFIDKHNKYLYGVKENVTYLMDSKGIELFKSKFICNYNMKGSIDIFNPESRLSGIYYPNKNLYIEPKYLVIYPVENEQYFIVMTKSKAIGYLDGNGNELF